MRCDCCPLPIRSVPQSACRSHLNHSICKIFLAGAPNPRSILSDLGILSNSGNVPSTRWAHSFKEGRFSENAQAECSRAKGRSSRSQVSSALIWSFSIERPRYPPYDEIGSSPPYFAFQPYSVCSLMPLVHSILTLPAAAQTGRTFWGEVLHPRPPRLKSSAISAAPIPNMTLMTCGVVQLCFALYPVDEGTLRKRTKRKRRRARIPR